MNELVLTNNALSRPQQGARAACGIIYPTGWIAPADMTYDEWAQQGAVFQELHQSLSWLIGDWIIAGQHRFGEKYTQALLITNKSIETLEQYVWVCGAIEQARRYPPESGISYTHHRYVARLPPDQQDTWLRMAYQDGWSSAELKQKLSERAGSEPAEPATRFTIRSTPEQASDFIRSHFDNQWITEFINTLKGYYVSI